MDSKIDDERRVLLFLLFGIFILSSLFAVYSLHFDYSEKAAGNMITGAGIKNLQNGHIHDNIQENPANRRRSDFRENPIVKKIRLTK